MYQDPVNKFDLDGRCWTGFNWACNRAKKAINKVASFVAVPVYLVYFVPYEGLKHLDAHVGKYGGLGLGPLLPGLWSAEAFGLAGDAGLDWVKQKTGSSERIFDESAPGQHNQHAIPGLGRIFYLPGLWHDKGGHRHVDFRWF